MFSLNWVQSLAIVVVILAFGFLIWDGWQDGKPMEDDMEDDDDLRF